MKRKFVLGIFIISVIFLLTISCSSKKGDGHSKTDPKWLIYSLASEPVTLNYITSSDAYGSSVLNYVLEGMIDVDKNMEIIPALAKSYEISDDKLTIIFNLRDDVKWHDGVPFTSADVKFTYDKIMDPASKALNKRTLFINVQKVETPDEHTFVVKYKTPDVSAILSWGMNIMPKHIYENVDFLDNEYNRKPIGTGAYRVKDWKSRQYIDLERVENHWRITPEIEKIRFKFIKTPDVELKAYLKGDLDIISLTARQWEKEKNNFALTNKSKFYTYNPLSFAYIGWNMDGSNPFFGDVRVRQAMAYAIDIDTFVEKILYSLARRITGPFHQDSWAYNHELSPYPYSPEKAKMLLKEAGWTDTDGNGVLDKMIDGKKVDFKFEILYGDGSPTSEQLMLIYQEELKKIGVILELHKIEWSSFSQRLNNRDYQAVILAWSLSLDPDPTDIFHSRNIETGLNYGSYKNAMVDKLSEENIVEFDRKKRAEILQEVHKIIYEDQPYLFLWSPKALVYVQNRFENIETTPSGIAGFYPGVLGWTINKDYLK